MAPRNTPAATGKITSDYGLLSVCNPEYDQGCNLPDLRFETGDLIIKLSNDREDWLLVHSEVVAASSPMLAASLSSAWAECAQLDTIKHPVTGEERQVRSLALKQLEGTFFLEGKNVDIGSEEDAVRFQHSDWTTSGWPDLERSQQSQPKETPLRDTIQALRILFALFYGAQLNTNRIVGAKEVSPAGIYHMDEVVDLVSTVCAYAEYFECGEHIKTGIVRAMQSSPGYWIAVADHPKRHITLAIRLQLHEVYWDALRHMVAQAWDVPSGTVVDWSDVADAMGKTEDEVREFFEPQMKDMPNLVARLNRDLMRLSLEPVKAWNGGWYTAFTTFVNALQFKSLDRSLSTQANEAAGLFARGMWTQFYIGSFYGEQLEEKGYKGKIVPKQGSQHLNRIVHNIQRAGTARDPSHIFGAATPAHLGSIFNVGNGFNTAAAIKHALREIVAEANRVIINVFSPEVTFDMVWGRCFYGRANFDAHNSGYFTYMKVPSDVPWAEKKRLVAAGEVIKIPPRVDMRDASEEWIAAVALALGAETEGEDAEGEAVESEDV